MPKTTTQGTKLFVEDPAMAGTYIQVGNITTLPAPTGGTKPEVDTSDFDSEAAESLPGLPDNGMLEFGGNYNKANAGQSLLFDDSLDPDSPVRNFRVEFTQQDERFSFAGWVRQFQPTAGGLNQPYTYTGSIRVSGAVTRGAIAP